MTHETLYYDGACPLCTREMKHLAKLKQESLALVDIHTIEVTDVLILLSDFGCASDCIADIDGDGATNVNDILLLLAAFGEDC